MHENAKFCISSVRSASQSDKHWLNYNTNNKICLHIHSLSVDKLKEECEVLGQNMMTSLNTEVTGRGVKDMKLFPSYVPTFPIFILLQTKRIFSWKFSHLLHFRLIVQSAILPQCKMIMCPMSSRSADVAQIFSSSFSALFQFPDFQPPASHTTSFIPIKST